jgi:arginyl-tRNA synthetase
MRHGGIEDSITSLLKSSVASVLTELNPTHTAQESKIKIELDIPKDKAHGELSANIALKAAKFAGQEPLALANLIRERFEAGLRSSRLRTLVERVEVKPPGFINFFLTAKSLSKVLLAIKRKRERFGKCGIGQGVRLQIEFVSANPTGPLTIAHARQAAVGDSLAKILQFCGWRVTKEYYINDEGNQIDILGNSIMGRYLELCGTATEFPPDGYKGSYITDIAKALKARSGKEHLMAKDAKPFADFGLKWIMKDIKKDLADFGVKFDTWYSQKALRQSSKIKRAIDILRKRGFIYESEGAVWFRSQSLSDDKDRVVFKSDGSPTYLAPDIAYHLEKYKRGFRKVIDIWGPDHHGYIPRMKAAIEALGYPPESFSALIVQLATIYRNGQAVSMSTRAGEYITLREVMNEVGGDVTRFCLLMRRLSSHLDFDLDVVKKESQENPVYYIQYAHARIWSILERGRKLRSPAKFDSGLLKEEEEMEILRILRQFPKVVAASATNLEPYMLLQYLQDLATAFHSFYTKHRVISNDPRLTKARIVLIDCVRIVLANGLRLLGVSFPKQM